MPDRHDAPREAIGTEATAPALEQSPGPGSRLERALLVATVAALAILLAAASLRRIGPEDFWWQIKTGEYVMQHGPPKTDVFSYTRAGHEWIELHWLYCVYLHQLVGAFGAPAATIAAAIIIACSLVILTAVGATRRTAAAACVVLAIVILTGRLRFYARPEVFTFLFIAIYLWSIDRFRRKGGRAIFLIPLLQVFWFNFQALGIMGPMIVGMGLVASLLPIPSSDPAGPARRMNARELRILAFVLLATIMACLVNPYGVRGLLFPFIQFSHLRGTIFKSVMSELVGPFTLLGHYAPITHFVALIAISGLTSLANFRRLDPFLALVAGSQLYIAVLAARNVPLFALASVPLILDNLRKISWSRLAIPPRAARALSRGVLVAVAVFALVHAWQLATNRFYIERHEITEFGAGVAPHTWPEEAVRFARAERLPEPIIGLMRESSYMISQDYKVFVDPRLEVYGDVFFERFLHVMSDAKAWEDACAEFGIKTALIGIESLPTIGFVGNLPGWRLVYFDEAAVIFVRSGEAPSLPSITSIEEIDAAIAKIRERLPPPRPIDDLPLFAKAATPRPYHLVGDFLMLLGLTDRAEPFLRDVVAVAPGEARARTALAIVLEGRGDAAGAMRELEAALRSAPNDPEVICQVAIRLNERGEHERAGELLDRAIKKRPSLALAWALRGDVYLAQGNAERAIGCYERALAIAPNATYEALLEEARAIREKASRDGSH
jgi:Tetratricopeptide repeat